MEAVTERAQPIRRIEDLPDFVTRAELAGFTGLAHQTLARYAVEGKGPRVTRLGGTAVRYARSDIAEWLAEQRNERP